MGAFFEKEVFKNEKGLEENGRASAFNTNRQQNNKSCADCGALKEAIAQNKQLQWECDTVISVMDFLLSLTELWAKCNGMIPSGSQTEEDIEKEFADGKDKIRTLFNDLIKTGEPAFLDRLFSALNLPEGFQHLI